MPDSVLDYLGDLFVSHRVLDRRGLSFIAFIEYWKQDKLEEVLY